MTTQTLIDQIIGRARRMKPAARARFIGSYNSSEIADVHAALLGEPKPRTPRPVLERRILAALAEPVPAGAETSGAEAADDEAEREAAAPTDQQEIGSGAAEAADEPASTPTTETAAAPGGADAISESSEEEQVVQLGDADVVEVVVVAPEADGANDAPKAAPPPVPAPQPASDATGAPTGETGANDEAPGPADAASTPATRAPKTRRPRNERAATVPPVGTVIIKHDRHGAERARCELVDGGVAYAGSTYKSLSAAALAAAKDLGLATKTIDGWAWWGLKKSDAAPRTTARKSLNLDALETAFGRYRDRAAAAVTAATADDRERLQRLFKGHATALVELTAATVA